MVKKKFSSKKAAQSKSKNAKTKQPKWFSRVLKTPHLLFKVILILAISIFVSRIGYMAIQDRYSVKLLDQAEAKMRQLELPGGQKGVIERYCSERSVKFGSPGKPTCGVELKMKFAESQTISNNFTQNVIKSLISLGIHNSVRRLEQDRVYYDLSGFDESLVCYMGDVLSIDYRNNSNEQHIAIYCQKEFQSKIYPIRD